MPSWKAEARIVAGKDGAETKYKDKVKQTIVRRKRRGEVEILSRNSNEILVVVIVTVIAWVVVLSTARRCSLWGERVPRWMAREAYLCGGVILDRFGGGGAGPGRGAIIAKLAQTGEEREEANGIQ